MITRLNPAALSPCANDGLPENRPLRQGPEEEAFEVFTRYQGYLNSQDGALILVALKQFVALQKKHPDTVGCRKFRAEVVRFAVRESKEVLAFQQARIESLRRSMVLVGAEVLQDLRAAIDEPVVNETIAALNAAQTPEALKTIQSEFQKRIEDFVRVGLLMQVGTRFNLDESMIFQALEKIPDALTAPVFSGQDSLAATILQKCLFECDPSDALGRARIFANFIFVAGQHPDSFHPPKLISAARMAYGSALVPLLELSKTDVGVRGQLTQIELEYAEFCLKVGAFEDLPGLIQNISAHASETDAKRLHDLILRLNGYEKINRDPLANAIAPWVFLLAAKIVNRNLNTEGTLPKIMQATRASLKQIFARDPEQVMGCLLRLKPFFQTIQDEGISKTSGEFFRALVMELKNESGDEKVKAKFDEALKLMDGSTEEKRDGK